MHFVAQCTYKGGHFCRRHDLLEVGYRVSLLSFVCRLSSQTTPLPSQFGHQVRIWIMDAYKLPNVLATNKERIVACSENFN
ncbi:hypothetical protein TNCV_3581331 [Trichonephila clavipes]|nr:hypothetical protein TNCV_3581331 [Trichonephila clavipes]